MKQKIINHIESIKNDLFSLSIALYENNATHKIIQDLKLLIEKQEFKVIKYQYNDLIIFQGSIQDNKKPKIGLFFNYYPSDDPITKWSISVATPMTIGAALGLAYVMKEIGGSLVILGVPWAKEDLLIKNKMLNNIAAAIMLKAGSESCESGYPVNSSNIRLACKNKSLNRLFCHNLKEAGIIDIHGPEDNNLSPIMDNINQIIPTIFPCIGIQNISPQEDMDFRLRGNLSADAAKTILVGSQAVALTAFDIINNKILCKEIKREFIKKEKVKGY